MPYPKGKPKPLTKRCTCKCGAEFMAADVKASTCPTCKARPPLRNTPAQREQLARVHAATRLSNPATTPAARAAISAGVKANHPSRLYPEKWTAWAMVMRDRRRPVSKLEDVVAISLPGWTRQHRVGRYRVDFADVARRVAIEVQGCYWHSCPSCFPGSPTTAQQTHNTRVDIARATFLRSRGWTVVELWEHDIRSGSYEHHLHEADQVGRGPSGTET